MAERNTPWKDGELISVPLAASVTVEAGKMVSVNSAGNAIPAADTASTIVVGVAQESVTNGTTAGAVSVVVRRGKAFLMANGTTAVTQADVGGNVVVQDAATVTTAAAATNDIVAGKCLGIETGGVWVLIG